VLHASGGTAEFLREGRGPALGLLDTAVYREARVQLAGDDRLMLYSDGLIERRGTAMDAGMQQLRSVVAAGPVEPQALLDGVLAELNPPGTDDVTLVALART
jgi:chemotaxis family two-component system sensor kinase Cph1